MKRIKKTIYLETITLVIVGLLITSTASIIAQDTERNENKVLTQISKIDIKPTDSTYFQLAEKTTIFSQPSNTLGTPIFTGITPAVSDSGASMVLGVYSTEQENVYYSASTDFGETWTDGLGWQVEPPELPSVDACGDGRYIASFVPNSFESDGSSTFKTTIADLNDFENTFDGSYWTWNDVGAGYTNFIDVEVAGYTAADPTENEWAYGAHAVVGDHGELGRQSGFFSYQNDADGYAWIYTLADNPGEFNGATSCGIDIDQNTLYSYAVYNYNNNGNMDIKVFIMDFGQWGDYDGSPIHENNWLENLTTTGNDNVLDVSAFQSNVIIVSERGGAIIAYYANGLNNLDFSEKTIAAAGKDPRISHNGANKAICEFIKDGASYFAYTEDGGVTWSTPEITSEEPNVQSGDVCGLGYVYESEETIYFAPTDFSKAILTIDSVSGGIGVSAVVKNIGDAAAENVAWSIVTDGTVFLGAEKSGQVTVQPGASTTIKTGLMLGFGAIEVTINVGTATKKASGKLLLFFITGLE